jgi:protein-S-isoprenylcysteine O-methyltransferase Ste14
MVLFHGELCESICVIVLLRIQREERAMIEKFGDAYREYMKRTGRFLPRVIR